MEAIGVALIGLFTIVGIGLSSQGGVDYPKENVILTHSQAKIMAGHLSETISDRFSPGKTSLKFIHRNTPLSSEMEFALRNKGYAIVSNDKLGAEHRVTYAISRLSEDKVVINLDVGTQYDLTGSYLIEGDTVTPVDPFTLKIND